MTKHIKKKIKFDISDFMVKYLPQIITCVISLLMSLLKVDIWWKVVICILPWILLCFLIDPFISKHRNVMIRKIADARNINMPKHLLAIQRAVESFITDKNRWNKSSYMEVMQEVCDRIRDFYIGLGDETIGYENFSISIKEVQGEDDDLQIREICRDTSAFSQNRIIDFVRKPYPLRKNTPFNEIVKKYMLDKKADIFVESDVHYRLELGDYRCTRAEEIGYTRVPYKSVCVSPILPLYNPAGTKIRGFICADADKINCFPKDNPTNTIFHECVSGIIYKMMEIQNDLK